MDPLRNFFSDQTAAIQGGSLFLILLVRDLLHHASFVNQATFKIILGILSSDLYMKCLLPSKIIISHLVGILFLVEFDGESPRSKLNANRNMVKQTAKMAKKSRVRPETRPVLRHWCSSPGEAAKGSENPARVRGHGGCVGVFRQHGVTKRCSSLHTHVAQLWLLLLS